MALTYRWEVTGLQVRNQTNSEGAELTDAVVQTYWMQYGTDDNGNEGTFSGATPFTAVDVPAGEFTSFADLTEATVLTWIQDHVVANPGYQDHIDEQIIRAIERVTHVQSDKAMPWAPEAPFVDPTPPLPDDAPAGE